MRMPKALLVCLLLIPRLSFAVDYTITVVDGLTTNIGSFIPSGTNNLLIVTNAGIATVSTIATQSGARSNAVFVVGSGSILSNSTVTFSPGGFSNALVVRDGGALARNLTTGGTNNLLLIENSNIRLPNATFGGRTNKFILNDATVDIGSGQINTLFSDYRLNHSQWSIGDFQSDVSRSNLFVLSQGSAISAGNLFVSGWGNRVQITDPGSLLKATNIFSVQNSGFTNLGQTIEFSAGARGEVLRDLDLGFSSANNRIALDGSGTLVTVAGALNVGFGAAAPGRWNTVAVTGGAILQTGSATIGSGVGNSVSVSGNGSLWTNEKTIQLNDSSNRIDVLDGARVASLKLVNNGKSNLITISPTSSLTVTGDFSVAKTLKVTGGGSLSSGQFIATGPPGQSMELAGATTWNVASNLFFSTQGNTLVISEGSAAGAAQLQMGLFVNGVESANSNIVTVTGPNSLLSLSSIVMTSRWQSLFVADGARLNSGAFTTMRGNTVVEISGADSVWENPGDIVTAPFSTNDIFRVLSGAAVTNGSATIGAAATNSTAFRTYSALRLDGLTSRWITTSNLIVGEYANSNSFSISNGANCLVSDLIIGFAENPSRSAGGENTFVIDGADSHLTAQGTIRLGYGSTSNLFAISGGASVNASAFTAGQMPRFTSFPPVSNVVSVLGPNSLLTVSANLSIGGYSHLVVSNHARIVAGGPVVLPDNAAIRAQSQFNVTGFLQCISPELLIEDSTLSSGEFQFGGLFRPMHARLIGPQTLVDAGAVHIAMSDPRVATNNGAAIFEVLNGATVRTPWLTVGFNAVTNPPVINIDGGFINPLTSEGPGLVELHHGAINILHGALRTEKLRVKSNDAAITASGALLIGAGPTDFDGDLHIGIERGEMELRGTNQFSNATIGTVPDSAALLTLQPGGQLHITGQTTFGAGSQLKFVVNTASNAIPLLTDGAVTLGGRLAIALAPGSTLKNTDSIVLLTALNISGTFDNVTSGQRITTTEGAASFRVNITPTSVILTGLQPELTLNVALDASASHIRLTYASALEAQVQTSTNLIDWRGLQRPSPPPLGDQIQLDLPIDPTEPQRFYRLYR